VSLAAHPHPWKPLPDGPTPICDVLITSWLATHRQHYPGEPSIGRQPKIILVPTPILDQAVKEALDSFQTERKEVPRRSRHTR
jgi:hypothetical protein